MIETDKQTKNMRQSISIFRSSKFSQRILYMLLMTIVFTFIPITHMTLHSNNNNTQTLPMDNMNNNDNHHKQSEWNSNAGLILHPTRIQQLDNHTLSSSFTTTTIASLDQLIAPNNNTIIGNVQFLLDFAIIGFGKCGTSTIMDWLAQHEEIQCFRTELWDFMKHRPDQLVRRLYQELPAGDHYKRGYKSPGEVTQGHILNYYRTYFPKTKLFIGVRHPIRWFESLYNFRLQNLLPGEQMLHPNQLIGRCTKRMRNCCTEKGNFAYNLLMLGKHLEKSSSGITTTTTTSSYQMTLLEDTIVGKYPRGWFNTSKVNPIPNPVFFFDIHQLADDDKERQYAFRQDVKNYLGLNTDLPPLSHYKPGRLWNDTIQKQKDTMKIDICEPTYIPVRRELMKLSKQNSEWIRTVFLDSPNVFYSSRSYLEELLLEWMNDPCSNETEIIHYSGPTLKFRSS